MRMTTARWKRSRPSLWRTRSWRRSSKPSAPSGSFLLTLVPPSTPSSRRLSRRCGRSSTFPTRTSGGRPSTPSLSSPSPTTRQGTREQRSSLPGLHNYAYLILYFCSQFWLCYHVLSAGSNLTNGPLAERGGLTINHSGVPLWFMAQCAGSNEKGIGHFLMFPAKRNTACCDLAQF